MEILWAHADWVGVEGEICFFQAVAAACGYVNPILFCACCIYTPRAATRSPSAHALFPIAYIRVTLRMPYLQIPVLPCVGDLPPLTPFNGYSLNST